MTYGSPSRAARWQQILGNPFLRRDAQLALAYLLTASIALLFSRFANGMAMSWFATSLLVPRLALTRKQHWRRPVLLCALAGMIATATFGAGPAAAPLFAAASMLEAVLGAVILRRYMPDGRYFDTVRRVGTFMAIVGVLAPVASAFVGASAATMAIRIPYPSAWLNWIAAHGLGALTYMPIVALLMRPNTRSRLREIRQAWNATDWWLAILTLALSVIVFAQTTLPMLFLVMLPLTLVTMRHGRLGASASIFVITIVGGGLTVAGLGPVTLIKGPPAEKVVFFQFFLATCIVIALPMAAELNRRRYVNRRLQESEALFRLMTNRSGDALFNLSLDGIIRYVSPSVTTIGNYTQAQLIGTQSIRLVHEDDQEAVRQAHIDAITHTDETFVFEYRALTGDRRVVWFETHTRAMVDEHGQAVGVVSAVRDVSHRKALEGRLSDAASKDPLTGLANRRVFDERLETALARSRDGASAGCLVIADIDHFKRVNDKFGHPCGDTVLRDVAAILSGSLRGTDTICRIGGEEFALILWGLDIEDGYALCERVRQRLARTPIETLSGPVNVTISMGIVDIGRHVLAGEAVQAADHALYDAKNAGRNRLAIAA